MRSGHTARDSARGSVKIEWGYGHQRWMGTHGHAVTRWVRRTGAILGAVRAD
jgi:hypothetical protein